MDKHVHIRMSAEHHKMIEEVAKRVGLTVSAFMRLAAINEANVLQREAEDGR